MGVGGSVGFPGSASDEAPACRCSRDARDTGSIPGLGKSPGEGNGNSLVGFLPGKFQRERNLAGYSPGGHKESDTTRACTHMARLGEMKNLGRAAEVK